MNKLLGLELKSDVLGATASFLCLIHCFATPFLFVMHIGQRAHGHSQPFWWGTLDIIFICVSLFSVYWSARHSSKNWMKYALWGSWILLAFIIINEKFEMLELVEEFIFLPSISLVLLHIYNRKYCKCNEDDCCVNV